MNPTFSLFSSYPEFQRKHFPHMMNSKGLTIAKLRLHGARVIREISVMVEHVKAGNDEDLMAKIKQVSDRKITENLAFVKIYLLY